LSIGVAFATPLYIVDMDTTEIVPYPEPPKGPFADITLDLLYANFTINPNAEQKSFTDMSYFVVVNITNNYNDWVKIIGAQVDAEAEDYRIAVKESGTGTEGRGWNAAGAWVDGKWYNLTWVPNKEGFYGPFEENSTGYWMQGVQIYEEYKNYKLSYTRMNMNGTWVDVTGRIDVERPAGWPPTNPVRPGTFFLDIKFFNTDFLMLSNPHTVNVARGAPNVSDMWAPKESRLIAFFDQRQVLSKYYPTEKVDQLKASQITFHLSATSQVNGTVPRDSSTVAYKAVQVDLSPTKEGYLYTGILSDNQFFVVDQLGEVSIKDRS
jgi:hypothetical protein